MTDEERRRMAPWCGTPERLILTEDEQGRWWDVFFRESSGGPGMSRGEHEALVRVAGNRADRSILEYRERIL